MTHWYQDHTLLRLDHSLAFSKFKKDHIRVHFEVIARGRLAGFHLFKPSFPFWPSWYQPVESDSRRRVPRMFWMDRCVLYIHLPTDSNVMNVGNKYLHFHFLSLCYGRTTPENHKEKKSVKNYFFNNSKKERLPLIWVNQNKSELFSLWFVWNQKIWDSWWLFQHFKILWTFLCFVGLG